MIARRSLLAAALLPRAGPVRAGGPLPATAQPLETGPLPLFASFPAGPAFTGRNRLVFRGEDVPFRTRLREAAAHRPDFAAHYVLATWGCGMECISGAAIDVRTGRVVWLPGTLCCWYPDRTSTLDMVEPLRFRLNSRLLIMRGRRNERDGDDGDHYYVIQGDHFVHLRTVPPSGRQ